MKTNLIPVAVTASLLFAATLNLSALPPRQHLVSGTITAIDLAARTVTVTAKGGPAPLTFGWDDDTRFSPKSGCARCKLLPGQVFRGWYRREAGQNMLRKVSTGSNGTDSTCPAD